MTNQGTITLDWGAIWDILAIYNVKINVSFGLQREKNIENFKKLSKEIKEQIGDSLYNDVFGSDEYRDLYGANYVVFKKIEEAQKTVGLAKEIDSLNYERYLKKTALQKKYFGETINEVKIGYLKNE